MEPALPGESHGESGLTVRERTHLNFLAQTDDSLLKKRNRLPSFKNAEVKSWFFRLPDPKSSFSDLGLTSGTTCFPQSRRLSNSLSCFLLRLLVCGYTLSFPLHLRFSPGAVFSVGTGCGSAGSWRIVTGHFFLGDEIQRSRRPMLLSLGWEGTLGQGGRLRIRWWF